jgi:hypothetical protein
MERRNGFIEQISRNKSILQLLFGESIYLENSRLMNPMVSLDLRDFFPCEDYGHLMS